MIKRTFVVKNKYYEANLLIQTDQTFKITYPLSPSPKIMSLHSHILKLHIIMHDKCTLYLELPLSLLRAWHWMSSILLGSVECCNSSTQSQWGNSYKNNVTITVSNSSSIIPMNKNRKKYLLLHKYTNVCSKAK